MYFPILTGVENERLKNRRNTCEKWWFRILVLRVKVTLLPMAYFIFSLFHKNALGSNFELVADICFPSQQGFKMHVSLAEKSMIFLRKMFLFHVNFQGEVQFYAIFLIYNFFI